MKLKRKNVAPKTDVAVVRTSLRINLSKHQNASASSLSSTIMGEHKSLIPIEDVKMVKTCKFSLIQ
jgi:hypothetical protein